MIEVAVTVMENLIEKLERTCKGLASSPQLSEKNLLQFAINVMVAENRIEDLLSKTTDEEKKRELLRAYERVKSLRNNVIRMYMSLLLRGKPIKAPYSSFKPEMWRDFIYGKY